MEILTNSDLSEEFENEWAYLFSVCFLKTDEIARSVFKKYHKHEARFCIMREEGRLCACYSGLLVNFSGYKVFISTDTMSDGTRRGASVILGEKLYEYLKECQVEVVCGYPNSRIRGLRELKLHWNIHGGLYLFFGIPFLWRFLRKSGGGPSLWRLNRPKSGFFGAIIPGFRPLGRLGLYGSGAGVVFTLSAKSPGAFFIKVPRIFRLDKVFGYRFLRESPEFEEIFLMALERLDIDTIDVP